MKNLTQTLEWEFTKAFYGERKTEKTKRFLLEHVAQSVGVLAQLGVGDQFMKAMCIHPLVQNDQTLCTVITNNYLPKAITANCIEPFVAAMEFRRVANQFRPDDLDSAKAIPLSEWPAVNKMLIADKIANRYALRLYGHNLPNYQKLQMYFTRWLNRLGVEPAKAAELEMAAAAASVTRI